MRDISFEEPIPNENAKSKVVTEISNAWKNATYIDNKGWLWVRKDKLHSILRTNKANAEFMLMQLPDEYIMNIVSDVYVRGYKVLEIIARTMEENGVGTKGIYLETSKNYYDSINLCDKVKLIRLQYDNCIKEERKKLKNKRRKKYQIFYDELTNDPLKRGCEFSHIRSVAMYKHISDNIDNGLVVNKDTHIKITSMGINDEEELLRLCKKEGWNTIWYYKYVCDLEDLI